MILWKIRGASCENCKCAFQFGLIIYSNDAVVIFDLFDPVGDTVASLQVAILDVQLIGNLTATPAALLEAANQFATNDRNDTLYPDVAFVFTDGLANIPLNDTDEAVRNASEALKNETEYNFVWSNFNKNPIE